MFVNRDNYSKYLKIWLISLFVFIVLMVTVGGLTRLTDSGLSITVWELYKGILPPLNVVEWNYYFSDTLATHPRTRTLLKYYTLAAAASVLRL